MSKPRIAFFLSTSGHSGVDRAMKNLIPAIARRGYAVDLLKVRRHGPNLDPVPEGVQVIDLGSRHTYACVFALARYLRKVRPAAMLCDKDRVNRTALLARWLSGSKETRLVLSSGTTVSIDLAHRGWLERWIQRNSMGKLYPFADQVIVTCEDVADDMAAYTGLRRDLIRAVPSPVIPASLFDARPVRPDHPWFAEGQPPVILGVGELSARKNFSALLRAFADVRKQRPCRLVILGRGGQKDLLLALAKALGVADDVALPGFQKDVYAFMSHAAVFAMTSRWEGLGFVLIEALACGTPCVAMNCPSGPREILQDGKYGTLVPLDDVPALAQGLLAALDSTVHRDALQQAALPYEIEAATDAYLSALKVSR